MHGHQPIITMRANRIRPAVVFINDYPTPAAKDWLNPGEKYGETWAPDHPTVCTHGDVIETLDLRFLVGLMVSIAALSEVRAKALFQRAKAAGALTVAASHTIENPGRPMTTGWAEIFHKETA